MNCWIILLLLLCNNQSGRGGAGVPDSGCRPVAPPKPPCLPRERECESDRDAERDNCPCGSEPRFEPRFDARPFNNSGCGCDDN